MPGGKLSIVVPCYNERDSVGTLLERVCAAAFPPGWEREIIVVDDASKDGTREVLESLDLPIRIVLRDKNGGKGTALVDGFALATGTHVLIQDADLEYDPNDISHLLNAIDTSRTAVYGSRNLRPGTRKGSFVLRLYVWSVTQLVNILYGTRLTDLCTCYKLFPREAAKIFPKGGFEADMRLAPLLVQQGYVIREVPITYAARTVAEGKKIKYSDGLRALGALVTDYITYRRSAIMDPKHRA